MKYTKKHEWIRQQDDVHTVGISKYAAEQLGDVVYVELPEIGRSVLAGDEIAVVESVKAASEVYTPVSGEIIEINTELESDSSLVNHSAEEKGWFYKIRLTSPSELEGLLEVPAYHDYLKTLE